MTGRVCKKCAAPLPVHVGAHRMRKFCTECSPPRTSTPVAPAPVLSSPAGESGSVVEAVSTRMADLGAEGSVLAVLAHKLAAAIDEGGHSAAGLASLSRELGRVLARVTADMSEAPDADIIDGVDWGVRSSTGTPGEDR